MNNLSRRGFFSFLFALGGVVTVGSSLPTATDAAALVAPKELPDTTMGKGGREAFEAMREAFRRELPSRDLFDALPRTLQFEEYAAGVLTLSVPATFLKFWIEGEYGAELHRAAVSSCYPLAERIDVIVRV